MSAAVSLPVVSPSPEPDQDPPDATSRDALPRVGRLLSIVHKLVAYGTKLLSTLQQECSAERRTVVMMRFGTEDLALIIARIKCGLQRAAALQARLNLYVERGRDIGASTRRVSCPAATSPATPHTRTHASDADTAPPPAPATVLALLPTAAEIAEQVRTRPIGDVIGDICCDLGLAPGLMGGELWGEFMDAVGKGDIDLVRFVRATSRDISVFRNDHTKISLTEWPDLDALIDAFVRPP